MRDDAPLVIVPLKALGQAKGRLAAHLPVTARRELSAWMLGRVVAACRSAAGTGDLLVVAGDTEAASVARDLGAAVLLEPRPGLGAALEAADRAAPERPASLVVTADLPLLDAAALDALLGAAPVGPCVVVAESVDGGTSALLRRPSRVTGTCFGPASAAAHAALAAEAGVRVVRVRIPELALDVDDAAGLRVAAALLPELAAWLDTRGLGLRAAAS